MVLEAGVWVAVVFAVVAFCHRSGVIGATATFPCHYGKLGRRGVIITIIVSLYFSFTNYTFIISQFSNCQAGLAPSRA